MFFLASNSNHCIAHDRRGHGRSSQPWNGNEMDTYADDLAELFEALDLKRAAMIGHSTGGGEVARYIGRHGTKRVSKAVLMGAVPPIMVKTAANPGGLAMEVFDGFRKAYLADRSRFFLEVATGPFFGFNRPGAKVSQGLINSWWRQGMMSGHKNAYDCIKAFSETDFTEDLKRFDVPTLIVHGDDDQIVPIGLLGDGLREAREERHAQDLPRRVAQPGRHLKERAQRRLARVPEVVSKEALDSMMTQTYPPDQTALLFVDPYNDFLSEGGKLWPRVADVARRSGCSTTCAIVAAVARPARVFIVPHHRAEPRTSPAGAIRRRTSSARRRRSLPGQLGRRVAPRLRPREGDIVIKEHWGSSGFANTDLDLSSSSTASRTSS